MDIGVTSPLVVLIYVPVVVGGDRILRGRYIGDGLVVTWLMNVEGFCCA